MRARLMIATLLGVIALTETAPMAVAEQVIDPPQCQIVASGKPGPITFTLHVTSNSCSWAVRSFCHWLDNDSHGQTLYGMGSSKTDREAPAGYGYEYRSPGRTGWTSRGLGHE